jgi:hypothetical protein
MQMSVHQMAAKAAQMSMGDEGIRDELDPGDQARKRAAPKGGLSGKDAEQELGTDGQVLDSQQAVDQTTGALYDFLSLSKLQGLTAILPANPYAQARRQPTTAGRPHARPAVELRRSQRQGPRTMQWTASSLMLKCKVEQVARPGACLEQIARGRHQMLTGTIASHTPPALSICFTPPHRTRKASFVADPIHQNKKARTEGRGARQGTNARK